MQHTQVLQLLITAAGLLFVDLSVRYACFAYCQQGVSAFIGLTPYQNHWFVFSIALPTAGIFFVTACALLFFIYIAVTRWSLAEWREKFAFVLILTGAAGNMFDRIYLGYVRDFIKVANGYYNIGDVYILAGIVLLIILSVRSKHT